MVGLFFILSIGIRRFKSVIDGIVWIKFINLSINFLRDEIFEIIILRGILIIIVIKIDVIVRFICCIKSFIILFFCNSIKLKKLVKNIYFYF